MKYFSKRTVETRNGCDIDIFEKEIDDKEKVTKKYTSFSVLTSKKFRRLIQDNIETIEEARAIADRQPPEPN